LGGVGTIWGALIGALIMSSLLNGLQLLNVAPSWEYLLKGIVLVLAVYDVMPGLIVFQVGLPLFRRVSMGGWWRCRW